MSILERWQAYRRTQRAALRASNRPHETDTDVAAPPAGQSGPPSLLTVVLPRRDADNNGQITIEEWCLYARQRTAMLSDLGISPFSRQGKDSYTPKILPSFSFLDHKNFTFAAATAAAGR